MSEEYEPLVVTVEKFRGKREGLTSIFNAIMAGMNGTKNNDFTLKLTLKEITQNTETKSELKKTIGKEATLKTSWTRPLKGAEAGSRLDNSALNKSNSMVKQ